MKPTLITSLALGSVLAMGAASISAAENPFGAMTLKQGYQLAGDDHKKDGEGKCGEGKCGEKKGDGACGEKKEEGKCGEGKCGEGKKKEGACGEKKDG